jgi:hypothetical protein
MPIFMRVDSDGSMHQVWAQEQANSCAVASIWMARNQALQMTVNQDEETFSGISFPLGFSPSLTVLVSDVV